MLKLHVPGVYLAEGIPVQYYVIGCVGLKNRYGCIGYKGNILGLLARSLVTIQTTAWATNLFVTKSHTRYYG
jgi:hypothetical protein